MKWVAMTVLVLALACTVFAEDMKEADEAVAAPKMALETEAQKLSYAIGVQVGTSLKQLPLDLDVAILSRAIHDTVENKDMLLSQEQVQTVMQDFQKKLMAEQMEKNNALAGRNLKAGAAFLKANGAKDGVVTTGSGLQYIVLKEGKGEKPKATDTVSVNYVGTLINGVEFDRSKEGQPVTFKVGGVIKGWSEALQLMSEGGKYRLFVPSDLAYGPRGAGQMIGPNSVLIFEVELLGIEKPAEAVEAK